MPKEVYPQNPGAGTEEEFEKQSYWPLCYPRIYEVPGHFNSPKRIALDLATIFWDHAAFVRQKPGLRSADLPRPEFIASAAFHATRLTGLRVPTFFVERDLLTALTKTTPPEAIDWRALHLPFSAAAFVFPRDAISVPGAGALSFLWYSRGLTGDTVSVPSGVRNELPLPRSQFYIRTVLKDSPESPAIIFQIDNDRDTTIDLSKSLDIDILPTSSPFSHAEKDIGAIITGLAFNLILAMEARPELLTHGSTNRKRSKKGAEFWKPNIIGKAYRIAGAGGSCSAPSGISHRMHWRRGHWRNQAHGAGRTQHRNIWIEPTLVAAQ